ncbi:MAG TPA: glycosyltransferase [Solirubrobacteraceae bacterium]
MRILMTTKSGAGHFGPLIPFAHAFRHAGADVLIAAPRGAAAMVRSEGLSLWAFDDPPDGERDAIFAEVRDAKQPPAARVVGDVFARIDARAAYPGLFTACQVWRPDVVISEITEFAGPLAAEAMGVPSIAIGISQQGKLDQVASDFVGAIDDLRAHFGLARDPAGQRFRGRPMLTLMPAALEDPLTPPSLPPLRFREGADTRVGRRTPRWATGDEPPLVYVTFGSMTPLSDRYPGVYRETIDALAGLPIRVLVTVGRDADPARLEPVPANVHLGRWVPQNEVMPHAAAMICHGGSGTVTMGLAAGIPMVVVPLFADQPWNAERVAALGAGIAVQGGMDSAAAVGEAVRRVLREPSYREAAEGVAAEMRALPPVDAAIHVVRDLIAAIERRAA